MKSIYFWGLPLLIIAIIIVMPFQSCEPEDDDEECDTCLIDYKPNIYIYPTSNIQLEVNLSFPLGGEILTSIPEYRNGWIVNVDTNGIINNLYGFLFYESKQPDIWQMEKGWAISSKDLKSFFISNLHNYGFKGREVSDFIEYWVPRLADYETYLIYPQETEIVNEVIQLHLSIKPDHILRLHYLIVGTQDTIIDLTEPQISTDFIRKGFVVAEWGVILK